MNYLGFVPIQALVSPFSGSVIRTNVVQPNQSQSTESTGSNSTEASNANKFVPFKGKGVVMGASQQSIPKPPERMPDIIIEGGAQYQELKDEEQTSQEDIDRQQKIMNLIKKKNNQDANNNV